MGIAKLENKALVEVCYTLNWTGGLSQNDVIKAGEVVEINCGDDSAVICHRSDGGAYGNCPANSRTLRSGDSYILLENGQYKN